ncbi:MAG: tetratricopeptide repeat protein [Acidobacteria bacterium]|nr:tetratricopeptide repeat protein [Acidobacteriota bacterium]
MDVLCQVCGAKNPPDREVCERCGAKLLIVSGPADAETPELTEEAFFQAQEALEEHLIERITALEEGFRQLSAIMAATAARTGQIEHNLTVTHAGVEVLGELLESRGVLSRTEIADGWERSVDREMLSRNLSLRFRERSQRILSQAEHAGHATPEFRRQLRVLEIALLGRQPDVAQTRLTELVRLAPGNDELWSFVGETAFETGDLETARIAFRRVLELRGPHYETLIYLGTALSDLGELDEAEEVLRRALDMAPESFLPRFTLGALDVVRERFEAALPLLESANEIEELPQVLYLIGICRLNLQQTGRAIAAFRRAVELAPDYEDALYQLGLAYLRRGWTRQAMRAFQQVLDLDPQRLQYQETIRLLRLQRPSNLPPEAEEAAQEAEVALEGQHPEKALDRFEAAIRLAPTELSLHATAALLASSLGKTRRAVFHAHAVLKQPPADSPDVGAAVVALLESLRNARRPLAARRLAQRLYLGAPDDLTRGLAAYELALAEAGLAEDLEAARDMAMEALEIIPRELRHYPLALLGEIALKRGRPREAVEHLEQAAEAAPVPGLLRQLAIARLAAGDTEGAREAMEEAQNVPGSGLEEELLGHVRRLGSLLAGFGRGTRSIYSRTTHGG